MRLINKSAIALVALVALTLTGCSASTSEPASFDASELKCDTLTVKLDEANAELKTAQADLKDAKGTAGEAQAKVDVTSAKSKVEAITARSGECERLGLETTGVQQVDGSVVQLPIYNGTADQPVLFDSTTNPVTPALLQPEDKFKNLTTSWADLVERVGGQQWYIDGVNARAAYTGFNWDNVLQYATVDKTAADVETRVIQVYNLPGLSDADARENVRSYMGADADKLQVMHIDRNFVNTINVGTKQSPKMGDYVDNQSMVRVSLLPIIFDASGKPVKLDASKGAGVFIDCANLHWIPQQVYKCTDSSCTPPPPTTPPTPGCTYKCTPPPCTVNCTPPPCVTDCPKDGNDSVIPIDGADPQPNDPYEPRPDLPSNPAPVLPPEQVPDSGSQAPGADPVVPDRPITDPGTGTTPDGGGGSVNPGGGGSNDTDPGNPF